MISICLPISPYLISLFGNVQSRLGEAIIGSAAVVAVTIVAYIGIRVAAWVQWALIAIEYIGAGVRTLAPRCAEFNRGNLTVVLWPYTVTV